MTGEGQEKDLAHAMNTAFSTFKKSKNETVKAQIAEFDPKAEEDKVNIFEATISMTMSWCQHLFSIHSPR
jgi:hypothetical protein